MDYNAHPVREVDGKFFAQPLSAKEEMDIDAMSAEQLREVVRSMVQTARQESMRSAEKLSREVSFYGSVLARVGRHLDVDPTSDAGTLEEQWRSYGKDILKAIDEGGSLPANVIAWQNKGDPHWIVVRATPPDNQCWKPLIYANCKPMAWIERRFANDEMVSEIVTLQRMSDRQRIELERHYRLEIIPLAALG